MATNYVQPGDTVTVTAPYVLTSGAGCLVGSLFGVALSAAANAATVEIMTTGVFDITKASGAVTQGAKMYWDNTNKVVTTTSTSNTLIGVATQAQASGDATCRVRLGIVA